MLMTTATQSGTLLRHVVEIGDGSLAVYEVGAGFPVIMLHGWTLDHRMWEPQHHALGQSFRLIMPDRRGFGASSAPPDLSREADDVLHIADHLGIGRFALAGLSQGAAVALDVAIRFPQRVMALALGGTPLHGLVPGADLAPRDYFSEMTTDADLSYLRQRWLTHPLMADHNQETRILLEAMVADYDGRDLLHPSALPSLAREQIAALAMPLLAIAGARETPWRIACARLLAETAPQGRFASIASAGHLANLSNADAFNAAIAEFLLSFAPFT